ncbi:AI-2E family transporter [Methyloterricola oryzae]|uniref:AI-2E family transporter n=1 Tax=Methyloterricola oryzae TaxID=1495050 RepID=UPI000A67E7CC
MLRPFIVPVGWAAILVYVTWPAFMRLSLSFGGHRTSAALVMTVAIASVIVVPLIWASILSQREIMEFFRNLPGWLDAKPTLPDFISRIPYVGSEAAAKLAQFDDLRALLKQRVAPWLQHFSGNIFAILGDVGYLAVKLGFTLLTVFFFYRDGPGLLMQVRTLLHQVLGARMEHYFSTVEATVKAVVYGIVLTAIGQGAIAGIGYWFSGIGAPILLAIVTMFLALIPFGTPVAWVSASLWLLASGQHLQALSLALWGGLVVSWVDNIIRPLVISGATQIPFLLVFFGVLGGLAQFGLIGLFLGPVVLAISLAVWREWLEQRADPLA